MMVVNNGLVIVSGQFTVPSGEVKYVDKLGKEIDLDAGKQAARFCGLNILAQLEATLGNLDRVIRCVKLNVFVNSAPDFTD